MAALDIDTGRHGGAPAARPAGASLAGLAPADILLALAFSLLLLVQIAHHEMWRDEIHSWGLVLDSPTLADLYRNLRYTGHPGLWYLLLWGASFVTNSPYAVQVVHAAIGVTLVFWIALASPFRRLDKALLLCSYFVVFEYTIVSRNYGIGMLLALVYADGRARRPDARAGNALLLGLLANTSLFGLILSGALACEYALARLLAREAPLLRSLVRLLPGAALYVGFALLSVATIWPAADMSWQATGEPLSRGFDPLQIVLIAATNLSALVPIGALDYWAFADASYVTENLGISTPLVLLAAFPVVLAIYGWTFRRSPLLLLVPALTLLGASVVGQAVYVGTMRHWGVHFVAFVAILWIKQARLPGPDRAASLLLAVSAAAGIAITVQQAPLTFSHAQGAARWIAANEPEAPLVGTPDTVVAPVAQFLGRPMRFLDCNCVDTYAFYGNRHDGFREAEIPERIALALEESGDPALFVIDRALGAAELAELGERGVEAAKLAEFAGSPTGDDFWLYRLRRR